MTENINLPWENSYCDMEINVFWTLKLRVPLNNKMIKKIHRSKQFNIKKGRKTTETVH